MYHYLYEELYKEGEYKNKNKEPGLINSSRSLELVNRMFGEKTVNFNDVSCLRKHSKWLIYLLKMTVKHDSMRCLGQNTDVIVIHVPSLSTDDARHS